MALITRSNIPNFLQKGLQTVFSNYDVLPELFKDVYKTVKSERAYEQDIETQGLGMAQIKQDGAPVALGDMRQGYVTTYTPQWWGYGFQISRSAIEDNLYDKEFGDFSGQLRTSLRAARNANGMQLFNNAFNTMSTGGDGKPLCSLDHPISIGAPQQNTFANPVGFNEAALEEAITITRLWKNLAGLNIDVKVKKLLVPPSLAFQVSRVLNSTGRVGTANNDINVVKHDRLIPGGVIVNPYLTNPYNWFILNECDTGLKFIQRNLLDVRFSVDNLSDVTTVRGVERYCFGYSDWRSAFGVMGAA